MLASLVARFSAPITTTESGATAASAQAGVRAAPSHAAPAIMTRATPTARETARIRPSPANPGTVREATSTQRPPVPANNASAREAATWSRARTVRPAACDVGSVMAVGGVVRRTP